MHVADPHTCSGYATANPEIGNKDNGDVEQLDGDVYDLAPNGDMVIKADVPKTKVEQLKLEANSHKHKLLHFPLNPFCRTCKIASMRKHAARGHEPTGEPPKQWGDNLLLDHFIVRNEESFGIVEE